MRNVFYRVQGIRGTEHSRDLILLLGKPALLHSQDLVESAGSIGRIYTARWICRMTMGIWTRSSFSEIKYVAHGPLHGVIIASAMDGLGG